MILQVLTYPDEKQKAQVEGFASEGVGLRVI